MKKAKTVIIILMMCILVATVITVGYSRVYFVKINDVYKLEYGARFIPVIQELCTIKGIDYCPELLNKDSVSVLVVTSQNYADLFLVTGYIDIK